MPKNVRRRGNQANDKVKQSHLSEDEIRNLLNSNPVNITPHLRQCSGCNMVMRAICAERGILLSSDAPTSISWIYYQIFGR